MKVEIVAEQELDLQQRFALEAAKVWAENVDTLIAKFFLDNPDVRVEDIMLVQRVTGEGVEIFVTRKKYDA